MDSTSRLRTSLTLPVKLGRPESKGVHIFPRTKDREVLGVPGIVDGLLSHILSWSMT